LIDPFVNLKLQSQESSHTTGQQSGARLLSNSDMYDKELLDLINLTQTVNKTIDQVANDHIIEAQHQSKQNRAMLSSIDFNRHLP